MDELNRQQICAELGVSESTIRRLERAGLPFTPVGARSHRYNLAECKAWLRLHGPGRPVPAASTSTMELEKRAAEFARSCEGMKLRVKPS